MTRYQNGALLELFDEIRRKIDGGALTFEYAKSGMGRVAEGREFGTDVLVIHENGTGMFKVLGTFETKASPALERVELNRDRNRIYLGEPSYGTRSTLGKFFTDRPSPETESGISAVLETRERVTLREIAAELAGTARNDGDTVVKRLVDKNITFSFKQAIDVLSAPWPPSIGKHGRRMVTLFVHVETKGSVDVGAIGIWTSKDKMFGKNIDAKHVYTSSIIVLTRTLPVELSQK